MKQQRRERGVLERVATETLGWVLVVVGIILWPLPGPGLLIILAGITVLSRQHAWARRALGPVREKAIEAARFGVATWPRITLSALGGVWLFALGVVWWMSPTIPEFSVLGVGFGPRLPAAGWATGLGLMASAVVAWGLLVYSVRRWRTR
ncbi:MULTISPECIES: PGPGW domain-containing protein [unclassified Aeromicrobium]|uniref:PGPGW domain-containing protein n=1 Tax=unclassified Aeromicrobium TaxID=2633570 RepID=UPI0006FF9353|nr:MULTISPECIES: PGPGW domain-containing protein [unclassified Aeromicrobium]